MKRDQVASSVMLEFGDTVSDITLIECMRAIVDKGLDFRAEPSRGIIEVTARTSDHYQVWQFGSFGIHDLAKQLKWPAPKVTVNTK